MQLAIWNLVYDRDFSVTTMSSFNDASALRGQATLALKPVACSQ